MALTLNNDLYTLKVGDYFWCKYTVTTANTVGVFSDMGTKTDAEATPVIPVASSNLPNGYFRYIMVEDWNGTKRLVADRNIQHSISWDVLNTSGIASGSGLPILIGGINLESMSFAIRLMTGGTVAADKDDEWDRHVVGSTLNGAITAGDNAVWNWSGTYTFASTTRASGDQQRVLRGYTAGVGFYYIGGLSGGGTGGGVTIGFRPVLEIELSSINKSFILSSDGYKRFGGGSPAVLGYEGSDTVSAIPVMTSNITPSGEASASSQHLTFGAYNAFDGVHNIVGTNVWHMPVNISVGWLKYEFPVKRVVNGYSMYPQSDYATTRTPKTWNFEGSNDSVVWDILDSQTNVVNWANNTENRYNISNTTPYKMYRLNILQGNGTSYVGVAELKMFATSIIAIPAIPPTWKTVSPTLPTLPQFQSEGMDDLSIFDRKVQQVLESPLAMTSSVLGVGKVFKGIVNLNKYFDLRKLEVK